MYYVKFYFVLKYNNKNSPKFFILFSIKPIFLIIGSKICSKPLAYALNVYGTFLRHFK